MDYAIVESLSRELGLPGSEEAEFRDKLADAINYLAQHDFNALVQLLYRRDVSESTLREILDLDKSRDAGSIIAELLIEREEQKAESRKRFKRNDSIPDDEKW